MNINWPFDIFFCKTSYALKTEMDFKAAVLVPL